MLKKISNALLLIFGELFAAFSRIDIDEKSDRRLAIDVNTRKIVADRAEQTVCSSGRLVARFATIQSIDFEHFVNGKNFAWWIVSLQLVGGRKIRIGKSVNGAQLSIVAAHLSTLTGKRVRAFSRVGW